MSPDIAYFNPAPIGLNGLTIESTGNSFLNGVYEAPEESVFVIVAPVTVIPSIIEFMLYSNIKDVP